MRRGLIDHGVVLLALALAPVAWGEGNVTAVAQDGVLLLKGDRECNELSIGGAPAGGVTVFPEGDTTLNGGTGPLDFPDIPGGVRADLGPGDDVVFGSELEDFPGDLTVDMGRGFDSVALLDLVAGKCDITLGPGDDLVGLELVSCASLTLEAAAGIDQVFVVRLGVNGETRIDMGSGHDFVGISESAFGGPVRMTFAGGDDVLALEFENTFGDTVELNGGTGINTLFDDGSNLFAIPPVVSRFAAP